MVSLSLLCQKDVISVVTGQNIGRVDDIEFCKENAKVQFLIIFGRPRFFGLFGRGEDIKIAWDDVVTIGKDVILVNNCEIKESSKRPKFIINFD